MNLQDVESLYLVYNIVIILSFLIELIIKPNNKSSHVLAFITILILSVVVGSRGVESTVDTRNYFIGFSRIAHYNSFHDLISYYQFTEEPILPIIFFICSLFGSFNLALWIASITTLSLIYYFCYKFCEINNIKTPLLLFLTYLISFYIASQQYHVMRSGLAIALLLNFYNYFITGRKKNAIIFAILAFLTHTTTLIPIICAVCTKYINLSQRKAIILYFVAIVISYAGFGLHQIGFLSDISITKFNNYLTSQDEDRYTLGFRLSFVVFNTVFLFVFLKNKLRNNITYRFYLTLFIYLSIVLFLSFRIPFFDRIGAFSWNIMPILTYYCFVERHPKKYYRFGNYAFIFMLLVKFAIDTVSQ